MVSSSRRPGRCTPLLIGAAAMLLSWAALPAPASAAAVQNESTPIAATRLADNVTLISGAGGNVVVLSQPDGLLLVNGGAAERSADLQKLLAKEFPGKAVKVLFNTDWHHDHVGLNDAAGKAGAKIIAHENTRQYLNEEILVRWENRSYKPLPAQALPNETFYTTSTGGKLTFGAEEVQYGALGQAHTDGDIYVYLPGPNLLVAGDLVTVGSYPVLDYSSGGWLGGAASAAKTLVGIGNAETRVVPGTGAVQAHAYLEAESEMLTVMYDRMVKLLKSGKSIEEMLADAPTKEFDPFWGNPELFIRNTYPGLWWHAKELRGII